MGKIARILGLLLLAVFGLIYYTANPTDTDLGCLKEWIDNSTPKPRI